MRRKDEFDEIAEWLVFNCGDVLTALEEGNNDELATAIAGVLREENIGYRDDDFLERNRARAKREEVTSGVAESGLGRECRDLSPRHGATSQEEE